MTINSRSRALDVFRGLTVAAMLVVNNPGTWNSIYPPLRHAAWNGCTPTDLVFPFFLFISGFAMAHSAAAAVARGESSGSRFRRLLWRSALLYATGLTLAMFPRWTPLDGTVLPDLAHLRLVGVLHRIALCNLLVGTLVILARPRTQLIAMGCLVAIYAVFMYLFAVPGHGAGDLSPEGNAARYIDQAVIGTSHLYGRPVPGFDPEGLLSTLTAAATMFLGLELGRGRLQHSDDRDFIRRALPFGFILGAGGWLLSLVVPLNKPLWSPSYMLWTAGLATLGYVGLEALINRAHIVCWSTPFEALGREALRAFVYSGLAARLLGYWRVRGGLEGRPLQAALFEGLRATIDDPRLASLAYALAFTSIFATGATLLNARRRRNTP